MLEYIFLINQGFNMTSRITLKFLESQCDRLNRITNSPMQCYVETSPRKFEAQVGNYHISRAYGGYCLHRISNTSGGVSSPLSTGHISARELSGMISAYISGFNAATEAK